jgi:hypothetical protein
MFPDIDEQPRMPLTQGPLLSTPCIARLVVGSRNLLLPRVVRHRDMRLRRSKMAVGAYSAPITLRKVRRDRGHLGPRHGFGVEKVRCPGDVYCSATVAVGLHHVEQPRLPRSDVNW